MMRSVLILQATEPTHQQHPTILNKFWRLRQIQTITRMCITLILAKMAGIRMKITHSWCVCLLWMYSQKLTDRKEIHKSVHRRNSLCIQVTSDAWQRKNLTPFRRAIIWTWQIRNPILTKQASDTQLSPFSTLVLSNDQTKQFLH